MNSRRLTPEDRAKLALELTMRDALDGLEELASLDVYRFEAGCMKILGIEPPSQLPAQVVSLTTRHNRPAAAKILSFPTDSADKQRQAS